MSDAIKNTKKPHFLIVEARFYNDISDDLLEGASAYLKEKGVDYSVISVPGALEIPAVISFAEANHAGYDGYVALGCVIRGDTYHFDIVANESSRALMDLSVQQLVIGNGILTVENIEQAKIRAKKSQKDKGGFAAAAAFEMFMIKNHFKALNTNDR